MNLPITASFSPASLSPSTSPVETGLRTGGAGAATRPAHLGGTALPSSPAAVRTLGQQVLATATSALRQMTTVALGIAALPRGLLALLTVGRSERAFEFIGNQFNKFGTKAPEGAVSLRLPTGESVQLSGAALPRRIPKDMTMPQLEQALQRKVSAGHDLANQLISGTHNGARCTKEDVSNLMFFLQAKGELAKGSFSSGAFSIEDPGQRIRSFLDSCPAAYQRESSHLGRFQAMAGGRHRGIDCHNSGSKLGELLPNRMETVLYGTMRGGTEATDMPTDRLFLKLESHGAFLSRPKGGGDADGPQRFGNLHDIGAIVGHGLSFLATRGHGSATGTFKERIPDSLQNSFKELLKSVPDEMKSQLNEGKPLDKGSGIRVMLRNVDQALASLGPAGPRELPPGELEEVDVETLGQLSPQDELRGKLEDFRSQITEARTANGTPKYDHLGCRIGNEVIFQAADLQQGPTLSDRAGPAAQQLKDNFDGAMQLPSVRDAFRTFLASEFSSENLAFVDRVDAFNARSDAPQVEGKTLLNEARQVHRDFVADSAKQQLNLPDSLTPLINHALQTLEARVAAEPGPASDSLKADFKALFDTPRLVALASLKDDSYARFVNTPGFNAAVKASLT